MNFAEKIKAIRAAEGLSQAKFCQIIDLSISTLKKYESSGFEPGGSALMKITRHPQFEKYTLWLMTDKTAEASGQISPALSPDGQNAISNNQDGQKVG
ncbi:helix-turn-helix domain-containing protein [Erwinia pyrifoliae]|uniref:Helix-turn-helix domain-containing protein n=1 Tax=Erwinia pyrifoliae TaxID=79967 RepID=A0ABY5XCU4_ERWPY|nr:helix-turn-helix transcriptional regulator [Erwinia pyrifoliae]MCT2387322.1 helix-turn-helix domain-containing protein [Erwinia pyrifoliae]MCU8587078.1 helix-turn-helix domain-containing protein [Erwinia pyrifoliae]UWS30942.1 helix-turn-helix domain-containing protein [Erwinia pyrifoliae]UWS35260.1 helix-turn-helix domain-containing protein [Erwinia pyrifoliae]